MGMYFHMHSISKVRSCNWNTDLFIECHEEGSLELPSYYSDDAIFQLGPSPHTVWGFTKHRSCMIKVTESCSNNIGEQLGRNHGCTIEGLTAKKLC